MRKKKSNQFEFTKVGWKINEDTGNNPLPSYDLAFLLAPNIPIPNQEGNSIATLVSTLAEEMDFKSLIFSTESSSKRQKPHPAQKFDIAYYQKDIKPSILDKGKIFPLIRQYLITPISLSWRNYARDAANAAILLGVKCLVVEDVADFGWAVRKVRKHGISVILHQHAFTQRNYQTYQWKRIERNLDEIIFVSQKTLISTEKKHGQLRTPARVIYNGVNLAHFNPQKWEREANEFRENLLISHKERVITFIGRLHQSKGVLEALEAFLMVNHNDLHFFIVGSKSETDLNFSLKMNSLISKAKESKNHVYFYENVSQEKIPLFYSLSDYIIVPSMNNYEGLPKVVTEALSMGVPVIASDRGGIWELLKEKKSGWLIADPVNAKSIAAAVKEAVSTKDEELQGMRDYILRINRPQMDQEIMAQLFRKEISKLIDQAA